MPGRLLPFSHPSSSRTSTLEAETPPKFEIVEVDRESAERTEQVGARSKFWFTGSDGRRWLFKETRPDTGEDWAEKVVAELARRIGLPHAEYELAILRSAGRRHAVVRLGGRPARAR
jgi:hypothetical protein